MQAKKTIKMVLDSAMLIILLMLMAYERLDTVLHEWLGIVIFLMFCLHHALNWGWHNTIFKGKYNATRALNLAINILLIIDMFTLPISGILMSKHILTFIRIPLSVSILRLVHLAGAYWGIILMSLHLGLHFSSIKHAFNKNREKNTEPLWKHLITYTIISPFIVYGVYAFIHRKFASYLLLQNQFVFSDSSESVIIFFIDFISVMFLFAFIGVILDSIIKKERIRKRAKK